MFDKLALDRLLEKSLPESGWFDKTFLAFCQPFFLTSNPNSITSHIVSCDDENQRNIVMEKSITGMSENSRHNLLSSPNPAIMNSKGGTG